MARFVPPFCPNRDCRFHLDSRGWTPKRAGWFARKAHPQQIQRFQCVHCRRSFSSQTFHPTYWLKRPDLLGAVFHRLLGCSAYRQIAREFNVSPATVAGQAERLGRHCLLYQEKHGPKQPLEKIVVDGFESFEFSQYHPIHHNLAVGASSGFLYAHTDAELRRKGRMTPRQRRRRAEIEREFGKPNPRAIENEMVELVKLVAREPGPLALHSDEHPAYPSAFRRLRRSGWTIEHERTPSKQARTHQNPLFPVNLMDLLSRHCGANHKRETIAYSKRRASSAYRLFILQVWRNWMKGFSEKEPDSPTPAEQLGLADRRRTLADVLAHRIFRSRTRLPARLERYYRAEVFTRRFRTNRVHRKRFAD